MGSINSGFLSLAGLCSTGSPQRGHERVRMICVWLHQIRSRHPRATNCEQQERRLRARNCAAACGDQKYRGEAAPRVLRFAFISMTSISSVTVQRAPAPVVERLDQPQDWSSTSPGLSIASPRSRWRWSEADLHERRPAGEKAGLLATADKCAANLSVSQGFRVVSLHRSSSGQDTMSGKSPLVYQRPSPPESFHLARRRLASSRRPASC